MPQQSDQTQIPRHVAIVMDGNGRWARQKGKPRTYGHKVGSSKVHDIVEESKELGIEVLTLFAFSSENWKRPKSEVTFLMDLMIQMLKKEIRKLEEKGVQLRFIGQRELLPGKLLKVISDSEARTRNNNSLILQIAASYGGQWDITQAARSLAEKVARGELRPEQIDEQIFAAELAFSDLPDADLFIRTGGELRISNFLLWQAAYAEFYFTDVLWPDFTVDEYHNALRHFAKRQRRFGQTGEQVSG
ncbi:MAG: isoprenyl transferase [Gammaproteobacteria bacterium]